MEILVTLLSIIGVFIIAFGVWILMSIYIGWVATYLWVWFVVPVFGLPILGLWPMIGLVMTIRFIFNPPKLTKEEDDNKKKYTMYVIYSLYPLIVLGLGKFIHGIIN